jgi:hypothetical protein
MSNYFDMWVSGIPLFMETLASFLTPLADRGASCKPRVRLFARHKKPSYPYLAIRMDSIEWYHIEYYGLTVTSPGHFNRCFLPCTPGQTAFRLSVPAFFALDKVGIRTVIPSNTRRFSEGFCIFQSQVS